MCCGHPLAHFFDSIFEIGQTLEAMEQLGAACERCANAGINGFEGHMLWGAFVWQL